MNRSTPAPPSAAATARASRGSWNPPRAGPCARPWPRGSRSTARRTASGCGAADRDQRAHPPRVQRGDRPADDAAPAVPDESRARLPERADQPGDVAGERPAGRSRAAACRSRRSRAGRPATARYPRSASPTSWCRHVHQNSGNPCSRTTSGPSPHSATCSRMPLADTAGGSTGPGSRTERAGGPADAPTLSGGGGARSARRGAVRRRGGRAPAPTPSAARSCAPACGSCAPAGSRASAEQPATKSMIPNTMRERGPPAEPDREQLPRA